MRRKWAYAAYHLGESDVIKKFAVDFRMGKIDLPANDRPQTNPFDQPGYVELRGIVTYLSDVSLPEADEALYALADRKHAGHAMAAKAVLNDVYRFEEKGWTGHPYCLKILRNALDDDPTYEQAAKRLKKLVSGLPTLNAPDRVKAFLDANQSKFRVATQAEHQSLGGSPWEPLFVVAAPVKTK